ncbi:nucleotide-binding protein [Candidatus Woesearchaeota archaeon CG10_big_fil_rev_8_21_14_0_10_32_9]|nr:MAG: nucleotide-binding protein [Candidatus Woesearchaeota archaeon CG10_big_fil_rev_8_21_14_0_10_32_9]
MMNFLNNKTKVILDTNFVLIPGELGVDIFTELHYLLSEPYDLFILDKSEEELKTIIQREGKRKSGFYAKLGLILIKQKNLKTLSSSTSKYADEALLDLAQKNPEKTIIATQDKNLRLKLKKVGARVIQLRQKKHLTLG